MRGRVLAITWQEEHTLATLKVAYQSEHDVAMRTRLQGLWLLRYGWPMAAVAEALGVPYRTV